MRLAVIILMVVAMCIAGQHSRAFDLEKAECIAPAKPDGGHDITCRLLATTLSATLRVNMNVRFMPGGIGALAYNHIVTGRNKDPQVVVAASTGSALNLALKKYSRYSEADVRWLGAVGTDYGVIAVRGDAPWRDLPQLIGALRERPTSLMFGGSGTIGSQDWMKIALTLDKAGIDPRIIRYISHEGGGDALQALLKGHIQIFPGDFTEVVTHLESGRVRILAVFSETRLPGKYASLPTAVEQGYDVVWPLWRGYYLPPDITGDQYLWWVTTLHRLEASEAFARERDRIGLFPMAIIGNEFERYVRDNVRQLREMALKFGIVP